MIRNSSLIFLFYLYNRANTHSYFRNNELFMANSHGLTSRIVKKQAAQTRKNQSYKARKQYYENKQNFPKKKLKTKNIEALIEQGIIDERGFFIKGKKKNFITKSMVDKSGMDFYGMPR